MENALFLWNTRDLSRQDLLKWFDTEVGEVILCEKCQAFEEDALLVEFILENEAEIMIDRIQYRFPQIGARKVTDVEYRAHFKRGERSQLKMTLGSDMDVSLTLSPGVGGGTGAKLWPGGVLLALWLLREAIDNSIGGVTFSNSRVLELGAGSTALPSMVAAAHQQAEVVIASDSIFSVVEQMKENLSLNAPSVEVRRIDWMMEGRQDYSYEERYLQLTSPIPTSNLDHRIRFDLIVFSDCIYNQRGAFFLAYAISSLIRPGGAVVGALPRTRDGVQAFEDDLDTNGFSATEIPIGDELLASASALIEADKAGLIIREDLSEYRLVVWYRRPCL